jgi:hypothetical protein
VTGTVKPTIRRVRRKIRRGRIPEIAAFFAGAPGSVTGTAFAARTATGMNPNSVITFSVFVVFGNFTPFFYHAVPPKNSVSFPDATSFSLLTNVHQG